MNSIDATEISGIRTCGVRQPGQLWVKLYFRAGIRDQQFFEDDLAHLVEHLALSPVVDHPVTLNFQGNPRQSKRHLAASAPGCAPWLMVPAPVKNLSVSCACSTTKGAVLGCHPRWPRPSPRDSGCWVRVGRQCPLDVATNLTLTTCRGGPGSSSLKATAPSALSVH